MTNPDAKVGLKLVVERLRAHIDALERDGAGNTPRLSFDDLCSILAVLEASADTPTEAGWSADSDPIQRLYAIADSADPLKLVTVQAGDLRALVAEHRCLVADAELVRATRIHARAWGTNPGATARLQEAKTAVLERIANRLTPTADHSLVEAHQEIKRLEHDLKRQMTIASIECNEAQELRRILQVARPYISDRAGAGIIGAIDAALAGKQSVEGQG